MKAFFFKAGPFGPRFNEKKELRRRFNNAAKAVLSIFAHHILPGVQVSPRTIEWRNNDSRILECYLKPMDHCGCDAVLESCQQRRDES